MSKEVTITPALSRDVSFTEKVKAVDRALKDRETTQKNIKTAWNHLAKVMEKYSLPIPVTMYTTAQATTLANSVQVYVNTPDLSDELSTSNLMSGYILNDLKINRAALAYFDGKFPGFSELIVKLFNQKGLVNNKVVDQKKTTVAREEVRAAVTKYIQALDAHQITIDVVANVREYISIVKDVASIAIKTNGK